MSSKLWFKAKQYGYGWVPCSWEGWGVLILFIIFQLWNFKRLDQDSHSASDTLFPFVLESLIAILILIFICYKKGEKPGWSWGNK